MIVRSIENFAAGLNMATSRLAIYDDSLERARSLRASFAAKKLGVESPPFALANLSSLADRILAPMRSALLSVVVDEVLDEEEAAALARGQERWANDLRAIFEPCASYEAIKKHCPALGSALLAHYYEILDAKLGGDANSPETLTDWCTQRARTAAKLAASVEKSLRTLEQELSKPAASEILKLVAPLPSTGEPRIEPLEAHARDLIGSLTLLPTHFPELAERDKGLRPALRSEKDLPSTVSKSGLALWDEASVSTLRGLLARFFREGIVAWGRDTYESALSESPSLLDSLRGAYRAALQQRAADEKIDNIALWRWVRARTRTATSLERDLSGVIAALDSWLGAVDGSCSTLRACLPTARSGDTDDIEASEEAAMRLTESFRAVAAKLPSVGALPKKVREEIHEEWPGVLSRFSNAPDQGRTAEELERLAIDLVNGTKAKFDAIAAAIEREKLLFEGMRVVCGISLIAGILWSCARIYEVLFWEGFFATIGALMMFLLVWIEACAGCISLFGGDPGGFCIIPKYAKYAIRVQMPIFLVVVAVLALFVAWLLPLGAPAP